MRLLARTNEPVLLSYIESLLDDAGIAHVVADKHISLMEGSIGAFPRRVLVADDDWDRAAHLLTDAELGQWVVRDER
jgi:hypothetical protein